MILGVVLAGGLSTRFGSDKALAEWGGRSLLLHAVDNLAGQCEQVVVAGREIIGLLGPAGRRPAENQSREKREAGPRLAGDLRAAAPA